MNPFFAFLFGCLLASQVLYSEAPKEIDTTVLFHVASLGSLLLFGSLNILMKPNRIQLDRLALVPLIFIAYFFSVGIILSHFNGAGFLRTIEFPYRISNLLIILFLPRFVRQEKDLNFIFLMLLLMLGVFLVRDITNWRNEYEHLRMVGRGFSPLSIVAAIPFAMGAAIAYWNNPKHRILIRSLLLAFFLLSAMKVFLSLSRAVWIVNVPLSILAIFYLLHIGDKKSRRLRFWKKRMSKVIFAMLIVGITGVISLYQLNPDVGALIHLRFGKISQSKDAKMDEFKNAFQEWAESPIWGKGFGVETTFYKGYRLREQDYVHNWILQFMMSSGVIGLGLIVAMLGSIFQELLTLWRRGSPTMLQTGILITCFLTTLNIILQGTIQTTLQREESYFLLAVVISFAIIIRKFERKRLLEQRRAGGIVYGNEGDG